jgi:hypothetical protein
MDGNSQNHGYLQEDVSYDDLMNNAGWPSSADQYVYPPSHPTQQPQYPRYQTGQTPFDQYDLSQQSTFTPSSFTNSPYTSQYQHARPSDVFGPTSVYNVDPSLQPYHGPESSFSFSPQETSTISPHSLQYSTPSNQQVINHGASNAMYQHPVNHYNQRPQEQSALFNSPQNGDMLSTVNSLQYPTLSNSPSEYDSKQSSINRNFDVIIPAHGSSASQVKAVPVQDSLRITHPELLGAKNSSSRPRLEYAPFVSWDDTPVQVAPGLKSQYLVLSAFVCPFSR